MAGVIHVVWYSTVMRQEQFAGLISRLAPLALRYGATQYAVHRSQDDRYRITQMSWFASKADWYRFWDGPEMSEFRRRYSGRYQVPINYAWHDELTAGRLEPELEPAAVPEPSPEPIG